jgi:hypothetical protein
MTQEAARCLAPRAAVFCGLTLLLFLHLDLRRAHLLIAALLRQFVCKIRAQLHEIRDDLFLWLTQCDLHVRGCEGELRFEIVLNTSQLLHVRSRHLVRMNVAHH